MPQEMAFESIVQEIEPGGSMVCPGGEMFALRYAPQGVTAVFTRRGRKVGTATDIRSGFSWKAPSAFDSVILTYDVAPGAQATPQIVVADVGTGDIATGMMNGVVESTRAQAVTVSDELVTDVGTAAVQVSYGAAGIRQVVIANIGSTTIYLGGQNVSANSPIALAAGARYVDANAAQVNWYALSSAAGGIVSCITMSST